MVVSSMFREGRRAAWQGCDHVDSRQDLVGKGKAVQPVHGVHRRTTAMKTGSLADQTPRAETVGSDRWTVLIPREVFIHSHRFEGSFGPRPRRK
jgi:hypothetical protein